MMYRFANMPHVVPLERSWQDEKVVHSFFSNVSELIGYTIRILLDGSHEVSLRLNSMYAWPGDSSISMDSVTLLS